MSIQDEALAGRVADAILQDKRIGGQAIAVRVADGEVILKGIVDNEDQCRLAKLVAKGIPGVRQVNVDELRIKEVPQ